MNITAVRVNHAKQDITSQLNSQLSRFVSSPTSNNAHGCGQMEVSPIPAPSAHYFNVNLHSARAWNGTQWNTGGGSQGPPRPQGSPGAQGPPGPKGDTGTVAPQPPKDDTETKEAAPNSTNTTPAGKAQELQINNGSGRLGAGGLAGALFDAKSMAGILYARNHQATPTSNDGIRNAAATHQTVISDPSYSNSEQYSFANMIPNVPSTFHWHDLGKGMEVDFYHNWGYTYDVNLSTHPTRSRTTVWWMRPRPAESGTRYTTAFK
jgi:hypothetical protein